MRAVVLVLAAAMLPAPASGEAGAAASAPAATGPDANDTITAPPARLKLDPFYKKCLDANGLPVVSSAKVPDRALRAAAAIVRGMLARRPDILKALVAGKVRLAVMAVSETTTDIPEHSDLKPKDHWDKRARGLGATRWRPAVSCAEENLLGYRKDPYRGESILVHEFAHTIHGMGLNVIDKQFQPRLEKLYRQAMAKGLWKKTYAASNVSEYWAEGVQDWFECNLQADPPNGIHNHVNTRRELEAYDPNLAKRIAEVFGETPWRWRDPAKQARRGGSGHPESP